MHSARVHSTQTQEDFTIYKTCARFNSNYKLLDHENALVYLKLRDDGCQKRKAKKFSSKVQCRADVTQQKDGPIGFKTLNVKKPILLPQNGWANIAHHYDLGNKHCASPGDFLHKDSQNTYFEEHFRKHELKIKEDYKAKIESLRAYFAEINSKCNFTKLSKKDLYKKLRTENIELKSGRKWKDLELNYNFATQNWFDNDQMLTSPTSSDAANMFSSFGGSQSSRSILNPSKSQSHGLKINSDEILDALSAVEKRESVKLPSTAKIPKLLLNFDTLETLPDSKTTTRLPEVSDRKESVKRLTLSTNRLPTLIDLKTTEGTDVTSQLQLGSFDDKTLSTRLLTTQQDYAKYQQAYEELEIQNSALIKLTVDTGDEDVNPILVKKNKLLNIDKRRDSNFKIAEEFNKMAYYYAQNADNIVLDGGDSPTERKKRAEELMKIRKQNRKLDKRIFDSIVNGHTQREFNEESMYDSRNLDELKRKQEANQQKARRKAGLEEPQQPSSGASTPRSLLKASFRVNNTSRFSYMDSYNSIGSTGSAAGSLNKLTHLRVPMMRHKKSTFVSTTHNRPTRSRLNLKSDITSQTSAIPSIIIQADL